MTKSTGTPRSAAGLELGSRERLLESAVALFGERGYAATGVGAICEGAGLAKTALYHHFGNKEGLLAEVIEHVENSWIEAIQKRVYRESKIEGRIQTLLDSWMEITRESPQLWRLPLVANLEQAEHSPRVREALAKVWKRAEEAISQGIEDSLGRKLKDLDLVAHSVISLVQASLLKQICEPDEERLERELAEVARTFELLVWARLPFEEQRALHALSGPASS